MQHSLDVIPFEDVSKNKVAGDAPPGEIAITEVEDDNSNPFPQVQPEEEIDNLDVEDISDLPKVKGRSVLHYHLK